MRSQKKEHNAERVKNYFINHRKNSREEKKKLAVFVTKKIKIFLEYLYLRKKDSWARKTLKFAS